MDINDRRFDVDSNLTSKDLGINYYRFDFETNLTSKDLDNRNLHITIGYSLLKCKVDHTYRRVAGLAKG